MKLRLLALLAATALPAAGVDFIRQIQLIEGQTVVYDMPVSGLNGQILSKPLEGDGAILQLYAYQDESYDPEYDDDWNDDEGTEFCWIDATIAPQNPVAPWEPGMISLVPAEFEPDEALEVPGLIGLPHTIEILQEGRFVPYGNELVCGRHRLRMLFAVPQDLHDARFAYQFTYFGSVSLQSGVAAR